MGPGGCVKAVSAQWNTACVEQYLMHQVVTGAVVALGEGKSVRDFSWTFSSRVSDIITKTPIWVLVAGSKTRNWNTCSVQSKENTKSIFCSSQQARYGVVKPAPSTLLSKHGVIRLSSGSVTLALGRLKENWYHQYFSELILCSRDQQASS